MGINMKRRSAAFFIAAIMCVSLASCNKAESAEEKEEIVPEGTAVEVAEVKRGDISTENTVTGNVMSNRNIPVMAPVSGMIKTVAVKIGDHVSEGDVLFTMDTGDIRDTYKALLGSYYSTAELMDEQIRQARQSVENLKVLYEMGAVSKSAVEQAELGLLQAETGKKTTLAQMGADDVMDVLNDPNVYAECSGDVINIGVIEGVMTSNTNVALVISETGKPQAVVNVSETVQPYITVGESVEVKISTLEEPVTGVISSVASAVSSQTALYQVNIDLPEDIDVSVGMFATVSFYTDTRTDTVLVPTEAILTDGQEKYVFIVRNGCAYRVKVTTGLTGAEETEITSGLKGGESLVTVGQSYLTDGALVRVVEG